MFNHEIQPKEFVWVNIQSVEDGWEAINKMKVRGAPAIAICGLLCVATWIHNNSL